MVQAGARCIGDRERYPWDIDGAWLLVGNSDSLPADTILSSDIGDGRKRWDFTVVPMGGSDVPGLSGYLLNFCFSFSTPGTYRLGFQEFVDVNRTYYSDSTVSNYLWGVLMAGPDGNLDPSISGVENTIVVN